MKEKIFNIIIYFFLSSLVASLWYKGQDWLVVGIFAFGMYALFDKLNTIQDKIKKKGVKNE